MRRILSISVVLVAACSSSDDATVPLADASLDGQGDVAGDAGAGAKAGSAGQGGSTAGSAGQGGSTAQGGSNPGGSAGASADSGPPKPSAGCGIAQSPGHTCSKLNIAGVDRDWCVTVPAGYDPQVPSAVLFNLHGCGGGLGQNTSQEAFAAGHYLFAYPKSLDSCWETSSSGPDAALVVAIEAELEKSYCVDKNRVFAEGYSSGGFMATAMACAGLAGARAAATAGGAAACGTPLPIWQYHGQSDTTVPYDTYGPPVRDSFIQANGCSTTSVPIAGSPCVEYQGCKARTVWCTDTGGHKWPNAEWMNKGALDFFSSL